MKHFQTSPSKKKHQFKLKTSALLLAIQSLSPNREKNYIVKEMFLRNFTLRNGSMLNPISFRLAPKCLAQIAVGWALMTIIIGGCPTVCTAKSVANQVDIKSDKLEIQSEKKTASFTGNVRAKWGKLHFFCDKMSVTYTEKGTIVQLTAQGNVRVHRSGAKATANRATLHAPTGIISLEGNPTLKKDSNTLRGKRIEINLHSGSIEVKEAIGSFTFMENTP